MIELAFAAVLVALSLWLGHLKDVRHGNATQHLLAAQEAERQSWRQERHELNNRVQAPEVMRIAPPPAPSWGVFPAQAEDSEPEEVFEDELVGTVIGRV